MLSSRRSAVPAGRLGGALVAVMALAGPLAATLATTPAAAQKAPAATPAPAAPAPVAPAPAAPAAPAPVGPIGVWLDDTGRGAVEIKACGASLCGHIYWLQEPISATTGRPVQDAYNPDTAKRSRAVCGLQVIGNVKQQGDGTWDEGWVYDPKVGKSYDVAIAQNRKDQLTVTGYKGLRFLSKTFVWTRAPVGLPRCDVSMTQKAPGPGSTRGAAQGSGPAAAAKQIPAPAGVGAGNAAGARPMPPPARAATTPPPSPPRQ